MDFGVVLVVFGVQESLPINCPVDDNIGIFGVELSLFDFLDLSILPGHNFGVVVSREIEVGILFKFDKMFDFVEIVVGLVGL